MGEVVPFTVPKKTSPSDKCEGDGKPCFVDSDEPHWRCGTSACGKNRERS